jgi:carbonic anhydrase/acetyltransferase-like protein (isoleucine patch superfamily)
MDEAVVGEQSFVAACAFVPAGMHVLLRSLFTGIPVKLKRWRHRGASIGFRGCRTVKETYS